MTVSYSIDVSKSSLITFINLQLRWRGSIWKSVLLEVLMFCLAFFSLSIVYNHHLSDETKKFWDDLSALFDSKMDYIPLTFMLGFFVTIIVNRWNEIFNNVGWIDPCALVMSSYLRGSDDKSRIARRNAIRYLVLTQVLVFRNISMQVRKRFPSLETIVASGIMTEEERISYEECSLKQIYPKYFLPIQWTFSILYEARSGGKIGADLQLNEIMKCVLDFRKGLAQLCNFDWVPIPLVYPQVVFLAVRSYFFLALIARQSILIDGAPPNPNHPIFPLVPFIMTVLQFIFYVGWMKVAESLMNPLGEDDDDFECNFLIDRNLQLGLAIVDETYNALPYQQKDAFWDKSAEPLYSEDTAKKQMCPQVGSAAQYEPNAEEVLMMPHESNEPEMELDGDEERLLPRFVSIVSVNRESGGSRLSLNSKKGTKKGLLGSLSKKLSRESRPSRPSRLGMRGADSFSSLNTPTVELAGSTLDLVDECDRMTLNTPDTPFNIPSPRRSSPLPNGDTERRADPLTSVPEEDEEVQRTRNSIDLRNIMAEAKKNMEKNTNSNTKL
ncbi:hypothetical protein PFISCL1PPCAC_15407 [Pristionchus fissidentatus]|uniref:Bestrophin homolog n=1 Tax=Pristionchus fissidentatus TaxID=1538716 RepID=A0AAV5VX42_9BILA|nr:hypothetical protein PFISCL1PPCAC_15407 [Pristionchus fissidentatus]